MPLSRLDCVDVAHRRAGTARHPKARTVSVRTAEILRQCDFDQALHAAATVPWDAPLWVLAHTLAG